MPITGFARVHVDVDDRVEVHVDSHRPAFAACETTGALGKPGVARRAQGHRPRQARGSVHDVAGAALEIGGEQQRQRGGALQPVEERRDPERLALDRPPAARAVDGVEQRRRKRFVATEHVEASHAALAHQALELVPGLTVGRGEDAVQARDHQLRDALVERHPRERLPHPGGRLRVERVRKRRLGRGRQGHGRDQQQQRRQVAKHSTILLKGARNGPKAATNGAQAATNGLGLGNRARDTGGFTHPPGPPRVPRS